MRILQVVHGIQSPGVGGSEIYTYSLCKELSKRNDVHLFFSDSGIGHGKFVERGYYNDLAFTSVNPRQYAGHFSYLNSFKSGGYVTCKNKKVDKAFKIVIEEFRPDIIHFQHLINLSTNLVNIASQANIPMIFSTHDYWLLCPKAHLIDNNLNACMGVDNKFKCVNCLWRSRLSRFNKIKLTQPKTYIELPKNLKMIVWYPLALLHTIPFVFYIRPKAIRAIIEKIDLFIVPTYRMYDKLVGRGVPRDKVVRLGFGIPDAVSENIQKVPSKPIRFAFVGSLVPSKGIHVLIEAFNNIEKATLDIYGPLGEDTKRWCTKLIKNDNIKTKGKFKHEAVREVFSEIDILIVPSICMDNFPLVVKEAFATKTLVIASNIGGLPEMVQDGKTGLLFKVGDPKDLFRKIEYFIDNPSEVNRMSCEIGSVKTIEENAIEIENGYRDIINKRCQGGKNCRTASV
ncbi:MAG: glycosyltransferase [Methanophagales archaeon]|nr:glycosyltransferase [Methanophagales archaeon]